MRGEGLFKIRNPFLDSFNVFWSYTLNSGARDIVRGRKVRSYPEEHVLNYSEMRLEHWLFNMNKNETNERIEFINGPIGVELFGTFGNTPSAI